MKPQNIYKKIAITAIVLGVGALGAHSAVAATKPTQVPLMNAAKGAMPNVMISLDNSGSMAAAYLDNYPASQLVNRHYAMRSADINPMYYDPRVYYAPRVNADGTDHKPPIADASSGLATVNNPSRCKVTNIYYSRNNLYQGTFATDCTSRSSWAANRNLVFLANWGEYGQEVFVHRNSIRRKWGYWIIVPNAMRSNSSNFRTTLGNNPVTNASTFANYPAPAHLEFARMSDVGSKQYFRYVTGCATIGTCEHPYSRTVVDILPNRTIRINGINKGNKVPLPKGSNRSDCGVNATSCTWAQENANIIRWYNFYSTRAKAVATAMGQSLAQKEFHNKLRVGYTQMNNAGNTARDIVRGVRYWRDTDSDKWKTDFYNWLYSVGPHGSTPSHQVIENVAKYYKTKKPWESTSSKGERKYLACRRAYHIFLSDGAWNGTYSRYYGYDTNFPSNVTVNQASYVGEEFTSDVYGKFKYNPNGNVENRNQYISYADSENNWTSRRGLADLTAHYFWNTDFRDDLKNEVPPIPSTNNPTFWQNMTTYNIGWGLAPGPGVTSSLSTNLTGMESADLIQYKKNWLSGSPSKINWADYPSWDRWLQNSDFTAAANQDRINDFIRSGYTGGGKTLSVESAAQVTRAFNEILGQITSSGNDAGVAVSSSGNATDNLEDQLRYSVTYETASNGGTLDAYKLDAKVVNGKKVYSVGDKDWTASVNPVASRTLYALSGTVGSHFNAQEINANTRLDSLPSDFKSLLNANNLQKTNSDFIRYILGEDGVTDTNGQIYRTRSSAIGASVNSPPAFVGAGLNMGYGSLGDKKIDGEKIDGKDKYKDYLNEKENSEATLFAATNEGIVHVLTSGKAAKGGGKEVAAYMPKGAMARQIDLANSGFKFKYVLDGPLAVDDVYSGSAWRQVVTGTGGRGGKYIYAIDSPFKADKKRTPDSSNFLWEVSSADTGYGDMGYITNLSTSGQLQDGTWVTLINSGHYAGTNQAGLYVIEALTGQLKYFIEIPATDAHNNRGLGGVVAVRDKDRRIVAAYAGDARGNVWRFDLRNSGKTPKLSYGGEPLFNTGEKRPIYAAPAWQVHPEGGTIVNVATGILLEDDDITELDKDNAIYGLWDPTPIGEDDAASFTQIKISDLHERKLEKISATPDTPNTDDNGNTYYKITSGEIKWKKKNGDVDRRGWRLNLGVIEVAGVGDGGERVIGDLNYVGSALVVPSVFMPNETDTTVESCESSSLPNMLYIIDAITGKPTKFFKKYKASIVFLVSGGFTRGLSVRKTSGEPLIGKSNEGYPNLEAKQCSPGEFALIGAGGIMQGEIVCVSSWTRTWRNIIKTPFS